MDEERDSIVFEDDEGNEIELDILDYFFYEEQEYAILMDLSGVPEEHEHSEDGDEEPQDIYIMKVVANGDMEEFLPVDDELMDKLSEIAESRLFADDDEDEDDEDEDDE
jgi:hypothetical protein